MNEGTKREARKKAIAPAEEAYRKAQNTPPVA